MLSLVVRGQGLQGRGLKVDNFFLHELKAMDNFVCKLELLTWDMEPGDCLVHHSFAVHGAPGISSQSGRRRAYATRWFGEDVRFDPRPGQFGANWLTGFSFPVNMPHSCQAGMKL